MRNHDLKTWRDGVDRRDACAVGVVVEIKKRYVRCSGKMLRPMRVCSGVCSEMSGSDRLMRAEGW